MDEVFESLRAKGRIEGRGAAVVTVLRSRGLGVPEVIRKRIREQTDLQQLQRWLERAVVATSLDELIREPAEARSAKAPGAAASRERTARRPQRPAASR